MPRLPVLGAAVLALTCACTQAYDEFVVGPNADGGALGGTGAGTPASSAEVASSASASSATTTAASGGASGASVGAGGADSGASGGAGGMAIVLDVKCKGAPCPAGQVCCVYGVGSSSNTCALAGSCGDAEIACDGPDDCPPGNVCCATIDLPGQKLYGIHCAAACTTGNNQLVMCTGDPSKCPPMKPCIDDQLLGGGYQFCAP